MLPEAFALVALSAITWGIRAGFIVSTAGRSLAVTLDPWLTYARPAVLAGLLASMSVRGAAVDEVGAVAYGGAVGAALLAAAATRSLGWSLVAGVVVLLVLA